MADESCSDNDTATLASKLNIKKVIVDFDVKKDQTAQRQVFVPKKKRRLVKVVTILYMSNAKDSEISNKEASRVKTSQVGNIDDTPDAQ